jgi:ABC-2 type transport system permease protein
MSGVVDPAATAFSPFSPRPGAASPIRRIVAHATFELIQLVRNGEQLLLTVVIPTVLLVLFAKVDVVSLGPGSRVDYLAPGIIALAIMSTAFTGLAIATGFERRYGVLKWLGTTPLPRSGLIAGKTLAVLCVEAAQIILLSAVALALGWRVHGAAWLAAVVFVVVGTAAFAGLALLLAGTLRAEGTLAAANLVYILLLLAGGIVVPVSRFPNGLHGTLDRLPSTALADGLRSALAHGAVSWADLATLAVWAVVTVTAAAFTFRWE